MHVSFNFPDLSSLQKAAPTCRPPRALPSSPPAASRMQPPASHVIFSASCSPPPLPCRYVCAEQACPHGARCVYENDSPAVYFYCNIWACTTMTRCSRPLRAPPRPCSNSGYLGRKATTPTAPCCWSTSSAAQAAPPWKHRRRRMCCGARRTPTFCATGWRCTLIPSTLNPKPLTFLQAALMRCDSSRPLARTFSQLALIGNPQPLQRITALG
jgi:hypothetical protein